MSILPTMLLALMLAADPVQSYTGKYSRDPVFRKKFGTLSKSRDAAIKTIRERLGVEPVRPDVIQIKLEDVHPADPDSIATHEGAFFTTEGYGEDGCVLVRLRTEFIMSGEAELDREVLHEMTHAVLRERMPKKSYRAIPDWMVEGLAVWVAGQTDEQLESLMRVGGRDLERFLPGLGEREFGIERYAESGLAVEFLVEQRGEAGLRTLVKLLLEGSGAQEALKGASQTEWKEFKEGARRHGLDRFDARWPKEADEYAAIERLNEAEGKNHEKYPAVRRACEEFLRAHPQSIFRQHVLFYLGKSLRLTGERRAAEKPLLEAVDKLSDRGGAEDDALFQLGSARMEGGDFKGGAEAFQRIVRDHPESPILDKAVYKLANCLANHGDIAKARRLLDVFDRSFPKSTCAGDAKSLRSALPGMK